MVGRMNVKALQHNKKPIVMLIDRVLKFDASGSKKEVTENIHYIGIDLEAEREWARLDRERALGQQEDEEEEEAEVQWQIRRRTASATGTLSTPPSSSGRGRHFCSQGHRLLLLSRQRKATEKCSQHLLLLFLPEQGSSFCRQG
jgi:hypothetical protein